MSEHIPCPCGSNLTYGDCCSKIHADLSNARTAEQLMRSRYSAFVLHLTDFIYNTFHPTTRRFQNKKEIEAWSLTSKWLQLEIIKSTANTVEFKAYYLDNEGDSHIHHEKSTFKQWNNNWYYVDGKIIG